MTPCYPVYTAGRCMTLAWQAALLALTLALVACWLPLAAAAWAAGRMRGRA
jgi:hypothetical protein